MSPRASKLGRLAIDVEKFVGAASLGLRPLDTSVTVVRPDDLLVLSFDRVNLKLEEKDGRKQLVRAGDGPAYLIVEFQPQHVLERAYFESTKAMPVAVPPDVWEKAFLAALAVVQAQGYLNAFEFLAALYAELEKQLKLIEPDYGSTSSDDPEEPPIAALISHPSRLVFRVPADHPPITFTLPGLLAAMKALELSVVPYALPPSDPPAREGPGWLLHPKVSLATESAAELALIRPFAAASFGRARRRSRVIENALGLTTSSGSATIGLGDLAFEQAQQSGGFELFRPFFVPEAPREPRGTETSIEMPYRLIVSPSAHGAWFHADAEAAATRPETGKTELWHTRLGARLSPDLAVEGKHPQNILRAVWTWDPEPLTPDHPQSEVVDVPPHLDDPWRASLDAFDRVNFVHLSSNYRLYREDDPYDPQPLDVDLFMLSALGAWMDTRGAWDAQPAGLSVEEWRHRATLGRDHYVRVVYAGFLFPFGNRASVVKVTERKFHATKRGRRAYLRQRMYILVREPLKLFPPITHRTPAKAGEAGESFYLMNPLKRVLVKTRVSPDLDPPEDDIEGEKQSCFWPAVSGQPFRFHVVATDIEDNVADMTMPLIFVGKEIADVHLAEGSIMPKVREKYQTRTDDDGKLRSEVTLGGQKVAFARSELPDDTAYEVASLTFGAEIPGQVEHDQLSRFRPRFFPVMRRAAINVPSIQRIARISEPSAIVYAHRYLIQPVGAEFGDGNVGGIFLEADPDAQATKVAFSTQGDRSGGLITPDLGLTGLSRVTGPVSGDIEVAADNSFDPGEYFKALDSAKLFGVISLSDIIATTDLDQLASVPRLTGQTLNQVEQALADLDQLLLDVAGLTGPQAQAVATSISGFTASIAAENGPAAKAALPGLVSSLEALKGSLGSAPPGLRSVVERRVDVLLPALAALSAADGPLDAHLKGDLLPEAVNARFEWRPQLKSNPVFSPDGANGSLVLSVEAADKAGAPGEPAFTVTASLDNFTLNLVALELGFERVQFRVRDGKKPEIDVALRDGGITFKEPLAFIQTLSELFPMDGFADPPSVEVTPEGISAGFSVGLPNLAIGVFSLENLSLGAGFALPFVGTPMSVSFNFCTRENPFLLTVMMFGGGGSFGITMNADGPQVIEVSLEFGASISVDFGVASGGISAMAGIYFKLVKGNAEVTGYFRMRGEVEALGVVTVSIELYIEIRYEFATDKCVGSATITVEVDCTLFSTSVEISATKKFAGSGPDPTMAEALDVVFAPDATSDPWEAYCAAFA